MLILTTIENALKYWWNCNPSGNFRLESEEVSKRVAKLLVVSDYETDYFQPSFYGSQDELMKVEEIMELKFPYNLQEIPKNESEILAIDLKNVKFFLLSKEK